MRRRWLITAPIVAVLATGAILASLRGRSNDAIGPLTKYITYQATYFQTVATSRREPAVQVWTWLSPKAGEDFPSYKRWLQSNGWRTSSEPYSFQAVRSNSSSATILPEEDLWLTPQNDGEVLAIYSRRLNVFQAIFYRIFYKHLDFNSPAPTKP